MGHTPLVTQLPVSLLATQTDPSNESVMRANPKQPTAKAFPLKINVKIR